MKLRERLMETYDIIIKGDKYYCIQKGGEKSNDYEMRDVYELDCELDKYDSIILRNGERIPLPSWVETEVDFLMAPFMESVKRGLVDVDNL